MTLRRRVKRLVALLRNRRLDRELDEEILAHLEMAESDAQSRPGCRRKKPGGKCAVASGASSRSRKRISTGAAPGGSKRF